MNQSPNDPDHIRPPEQAKATESAPRTADEDGAALPPIPDFQKVAQDYLATGLSLKAHPMSFLRERLTRRGVVLNADLADEQRWPHGQQVAVAGIVLVRQRPGSAQGVFFMTLEDESGVANLVVWPKVFERYRKAARHAAFMIARGQVQRQGKVVHIVTRTIEDISEEIAKLPRMSRDFH